MALIAFALLLSSGVAGFVVRDGGWFVGLFVAALVAQFLTVYQGFERWRRKE